MWTKEQENAIKAPVSNLIVSAAAGSGKTAVMVERIINRIFDDDGVDIDKILVVTFTNAAASELKERIRLRILDELDKNNKNPILTRQLALIDNASICTIHSFCLNLIKENFNSLSISPDFKTGEVSEIESLKTKAIKLVFDEYYKNEDNLFLELIKLYSPKNDKRLSEYIRKIYDFSRTLSSPEEWKKSICDCYCNFDSHVHKKIIIDSAKSHYEVAYNNYLKVFEIAKKYDTPQNVFDFLNLEFSCIENFKDNFYDWNTLYKVANQLKLPTFLSSIKKEANIAMLDEIENYRKHARDEIKKCASFFDITQEEINDEFSHCMPFVKKIIEIIDNVDTIFTELKCKKNLIDFSDYEHLALKILQDKNKEKSEIANEISNSFAEIYVDEYQDCNEIQDKIFSLVSNGKNLFMVGDIKQSIYKFRDAAPMIFKEKTDNYCEFEQNIYRTNVKITLNKNFRSRKCILDATNIIFSKIMSEQVGEMDYLSDSYLYENDNEFYNDDLYKKVSVNIIDYQKEKQNLSSSDDSDEDTTKIDVEANFVAQEITKLISSKTLIYDKKSNKKRPINYGDIVILMRSTRNSAKEFEEVLKNNNIPAFSDSGTNYYENIEIKTILSFVKTIINPIDDINLVATMRSGIYNFTDNELLAIRLCEKNSYFYDAVTKYADTQNDYLCYKIKNFLNDLKKFKSASNTMPANKFLRFLVDESKYLNYVLTLPVAKQKKANIELLFYKAECFEAGEFKGIFNFIRYIDEIPLKVSDGDSPKLIGENEEAVRIMTIHKSKGLEFGVVFLCQCAKKFNFSDTSGDMLLHKNLGLGINYADYQKRFSYPTIIKRAIIQKMNLETLSEEQRILYVALTRAREKLYICATIDKANEKIECLKKSLECFKGTKVPVPITKNAKTYFDWFMPALIKHFEENNNLFELNIVPSHKIKTSILNSEKVHTKFFENYNNVNSGYKKEIEERLSYVYPFEKLCSLPSNITVTELKRLFSEESNSYNIYTKDFFRKPNFAEEDSKSAAYKGTIMHFILQKLDFNNIKCEKDILNQINFLVEKDFILNSDAECIDIKKIFNFIKSDIGMKITSAKHIEKEFSFKIPIKVNEIFDVDFEDEIILQGAIDLFFENDAGNITIIDYKTDKVNSKEEIKTRYETQLKCYKYALEKILNKKVSDTLIYLFDTGEII